MDNSKYRRTRWLVDHEIQVGLGLRLTLCMAGYLVLFLVVALVDPLIILLSGSASAGARTVAGRDLMGFLTAVAGPLLFATACMILHAVLILHRLAGPVLRFRHGLSCVEKRDLTEEVHLRHGDLLGSLAEDHNRAIAAVRADLATVRDEVEALAEVARDESGIEEIRRRRMDASLRKLETVVGAWRIDGAPAGRVESPREERRTVDV
ncbi:MAG: hypothetical protein ABFS86_03560 [Planctomycetota bacterium]